MRQVNRAMEAYYGPLHGDPDVSHRFLAQQILQHVLGDASDVRYTSPPQPRNFLEKLELGRSDDDC